MLAARGGVAAYAITPMITALLIAGAVFPGSPRSFQVLVFAAMLAALGSAGARLARWLVPDFETESRWTAAFTFAVAVAVLPATWMGHFGWMWPGAFLLWTAVAFAASRFLPQPAPASAAPAPAAAPPPSPGWRRLAGIETATLAAAILAVALYGVLDMGRLRYAPAGPYAFDDISYHLSAVAVWLKTGDLRMIRFAVGDASTPFYPILGEVASWVLFVPFGDSDVAARWTQLPFALFSFVAVAAIARRLGLSRWHGAFAALLFASLHRVLPAYALSAGNDHSMSFFTLAALDAGLALARHPRRGAAVATGAALGLLLATKYIGVLFTPVLLAAIAAAALIERKKWERRPSPRALAGLALLLAGVMAVTGGYTYLRNAVSTGNPIFPAHVRVAGVAVLPGWEHAMIAHRKNAPEFFIDVPDFLTRRADVFGPFFPFTLLPAALLAPALALARRRFVTALVLTLPTVFFLQFLFLMHDHRDMRYFLPGVALAAVACAWLLAQAAPWAAPFRAALLALITYHVCRRLPLSAGQEVLLTLALFASGALAVQAWRWARGGSAPRRAGLAAAALAALAALPLGRSVEKYQEVKLRDRAAPLALERLAGPAGARVAYVGLNQPYLFFGSRMQNDVQIVPRDWNVEDQFFTWNGSARNPFQAGRYRRWRNIVERLGIEYVVVARTPWADPERSWILKRPLEFRLAWEDQEAEIWRVLPAPPEPAERGGADRPGRGRAGRDRAPKPAPGSGSRS